MLRRAIRDWMIGRGPGNRIVRFLIDRNCRRYGATLSHDGAYLTLRKGQREMRIALSHFVYAPLMAERFDTYFTPLVAAEIGGRQVLDFSRPGLLQTYARSGLQFHLASFPEEDDAIESYFHWYRPGAGDTVFDIGAHCGVSTHEFSRLVGPAGRVIAFEPDPTNYSLLLKNIERHDLLNVTPLNVAIAGRTGHAEFHCEETIGSGLARHATRASVGTSRMVPTFSLEDAFGQWGPPQFCKIDIEGAEIEVVSAAQELLRSTACEFVLDTNHLVGGAFTDQRIEHLFQACGYQTATSESGMKTTWASPRLDSRWRLGKVASMY